MERTDTAAALDKGKGSLLTGAPDILWVALGNVLVLLLAADEGFIGFNDLAGTAQRAGVGAFRAHGLTDTMGHEPSRLVGDAEHTMDLVRAHALLGRREHMDGQQPLVQRHLGALKDGADGDGELLAAGTAEPQTGPRALALDAAGIVDHAAVRADRTMRPADGLKMLAGRLLSLETRCSNVGHGSSDRKSTRLNSSH